MTRRQRQWRPGPRRPALTERSEAERSQRRTEANDAAPTPVAPGPATPGIDRAKRDRAQPNAKRGDDATGGKRSSPSPWRFKRGGSPGGSLHPEAVAEAVVGVERRLDGLQALQVLGAVGLGRALLLLLAFEEVEVDGPRHVRGEVAA